MVKAPRVLSGVEEDALADVRSTKVTRPGRTGAGGASSVVMHDEELLSLELSPSIGMLADGIKLSAGWWVLAGAAAASGSEVSEVGGNAAGRGRGSCKSSCTAGLGSRGRALELRNGGAGLAAWACGWPVVPGGRPRALTWRMLAAAAAAAVWPCSATPCRASSSCHMRSCSRLPYSARWIAGHTGGEAA